LDIATIHERKQKGGSIPLLATEVLKLTIKISVILPTYRREALLCHTISDVLKQEYPNFELIVLDQSPTHEAQTKDFLEMNQNAFRYFHLEKPSVVAACNKGVEYSEGEILLFIDDDIIIPHNALLECHARNYNDPALGSVAGKILNADKPVDDIYSPSQFDWKWGFLSSTCAHNVRTETVSAQGSNMSFRKDVILDVGGFDEHYDGNSFRWETDMSYRLKRHGYYTIFDPTAVVMHQYSNTGGCENSNLFGRSIHSHAWYHYFFKNSFYFFLKNIGGVAFPALIWKLYRGHVLNRAYIREGLCFENARHRVFFTGLRDGIITYRKLSKQS
jgi:glycosyltransferase involved in cell wall biosynthesis